jgi:hypothetical protein
MGREQRRDGQIAILRKAGMRPALPGPAADSEIRAGESRRHRPKVDATIGVRRPCTRLIGTWGSGFALAQRPQLPATKRAVVSDSAYASGSNGPTRDGPASRHPPQRRANSFAGSGTSVFRLVSLDRRQSAAYIRQLAAADQLPKDHVLKSDWRDRLLDKRFALTKRSSPGALRIAVSWNLPLELAVVGKILLQVCF